MDSLRKTETSKQQTPLQRKTTLKWGNDGELSAVDMARILERLEQSELLECDLTCDIGD